MENRNRRSASSARTDSFRSVSTSSYSGSTLGNGMMSRDTFLRGLGMAGAGVAAAGLGWSGTAQSLMPTDVMSKVIYAQINGARMYETVKYLASPQVAGRQAGTAENQQVANFIANSFSTWGLKTSPSGSSGFGTVNGYFFNFPIDFSKPMTASFSISDVFNNYGSTTLSTGYDYSVNWYSDDTDLTNTDIVFCWYGRTEAYFGVNDFILKIPNPFPFEPNEPIPVDARGTPKYIYDNNGNKVSPAPGYPPYTGDVPLNPSGKLVLLVPMAADIGGIVATSWIQMDTARALSAKGVLMWLPGVYNGLYKYALNSVGAGVSHLPNEIDVFEGFPRIVLQDSAGSRLVNAFYMALFGGFPLPKANISLTMHREEDKNVSTVIGELPGVGGDYAGQENEVIIVSSHFDAQGTQPNGIYYPAAADDASGTSIVMEVAKVLASGNYQPKRTIRFICYNAEEYVRVRPIQVPLGELPYFPEVISSSQYVGHLASPQVQELEDIKSVINIDYIASKINPNKEIQLEGGLYYDPTDQANPIKISPIFNFFSTNATELKITTTLDGTTTLGSDYKFRPMLTVFGADNLAFALAGVPNVVNFFTPQQLNATLYHSPFDTPENLDPFYLQQVGRLVAATLLELASYPYSLDSLQVPISEEYIAPSGQILRGEKINPMTQATCEAIGYTWKQDPVTGKYYCDCR